MSRRPKFAVISKYYKDYMWYIKYHGKDPEKCTWVHDLKSAFGKYFNGFTLVGSPDNRVEDLEFLIDYINMNTKMTVQECLDQLDEKRKVLHWIIAGYGRTGIPFSAMQYLTIERICELYHVDPSYFEKL